jgi:hypothetical protein
MIAVGLFALAGIVGFVCGVLFAVIVAQWAMASD